MYGWINQCLEDLITKNFGIEEWERICEEAGCYVKSGEFIRSVHYSDALTVGLVVAASKVLQQPAEVLLEEFGVHFVDFLEQKGYSGPIRGQGSTLREWISNINEPHRLLRSRFLQGSLPEFWTEEDPSDPECILLHYYSTREGGLGPVVVGVVKASARKYFDRDVTLELILSEKPEKSEFAYHGVWRVGNVGFDLSDDDETLAEDDLSLGLSSSWPTEASLHDSDVGVPRCPFHHSATATSPPMPSMAATLAAHGHPPALSLSMAARHRLPSQSTVTTSKPSTPRAHRTKSLYHSGVGMDHRTLTRVFPFHVALNAHLQIVQVGAKMAALLRRCEVSPQWLPVGEIFSLAVTDDYSWQWSEVLRLQDSPVTLHITSQGPLHGVKFAGEIVVMGDADEAVALLLVSPVVANIDALMALDLKLNDLPRHSFQRDVLQIEEHLRSELQHSVEVSLLNQRLESESRRVKESLDALRTKRIFVRYVSHEIRTPLNVALLGLKCLENDEAASDARHQLLDDVHTSCAMAVDILNDLLLYEKMDDGIFALAPSEVSVSALLQEAERLFQVQAKAVEVQLELALPPDVSALVLHVDRSKLHQVLRNLVSNAIKFTRPGGRVTLAAELLPTGAALADEEDIVFAPVATSSASAGHAPPPPTSARFLRVRVTDSGCGISREDQRRLFGQFVQFRAEQLQRGQGSGLGLWIAANIVHAHGGRIGATSLGEGRGATFLVDLPLLSGRSPRSPRASTAPGPAPFASIAAPGANGDLSAGGSSRPASGSFGPRGVAPRTVTERRLSPSYHDEVARICRESRVLLVDDSLANRKMMRRSLQSRFGALADAEDGLEAVRLYEAALQRDEPFDVVLMDGSMPVMDGHEATRRIVALDAAAFVIGVTGNAFDEDLAAFRAAGAATVLVKPLNIAALEDALWLQRSGFSVH